MTLLIRAALPDDAAEMAGILNEIIAIGGTTAYEDPFDRDHMLLTYIAAPSLICCTIAESADVVAGFQGLFQPTLDDAMAPGWALIASFTRVGRTGAGVGRALFAETLKRARASGVIAIDATIRADNQSGLAYYSRMGFVDYDLLRGIPLKDGTPVDRIRKRFDLQVD